MKYDDIVDKIRKDDWNDISDDDMINITINGNNLFHILCEKGKEEQIQNILEKHPDYIIIANSQGKNAFHLLAENKFYEIIKKLYKNYTEIHQYVDNRGEPFINYLIGNIDIMNFILDNIPKKNIDDLNKINFNNETLMAKIIENMRNIDKTTENEYITIIKKLIKMNVGADISSAKLPIICAIEINNIKIVELLLKARIDVNIKTDMYLTPLITAVKTQNLEITELLLKNNADINYQDFDGESFPVNMALYKRDYDMLTLLLDYKPNMLQTDKNLNIPLHIAIQYSTRTPIPQEIMERLIDLSDMNVQNIKGSTPLHLLAKYEIWENYKTALSKKELRIDILDSDGKSPIAYVLDEDLVRFMDIVTDKYLKHKKENADNELISKCKYQYNMEKCKRIIKEKILITKNNNSRQMKIELEHLPEIEKTNFGLFNTDVVHGIIYMMQILKKYKNLMVPFQYGNEEKLMNDLFMMEVNNQYRTPQGLIIQEILFIYNEYFNSLVPHIIYWKDSNLYHYDKNLGFYLKKLINAPKVRYIMFKLSLVPGIQSTHANVILYDKEKNIAQRFEPYGSTEILEEQKLDETIERIMKKNINKDVKYIRPKDYLYSSKFQTVSSDADNNNRKLGDPIGYCLAWTFWFIEFRILNDNAIDNKLFDETLQWMIEKYKHEKNPVLGYIRDYSKKLDKIKNEFLIDAGIPESELYNISYSDENLLKISNHINKELKILINDKIN
jgi:ankyrin repeat protein